jgi:dienelactone hydrolase
MVTLMAASGLASAGPAAALGEHTHTSVPQSESPGMLISARVVSAPDINGTTYQVEYWSQSVPKNKPVKVTGLVVVPDGTAPAGGWPVVSWGHPTDGMTGNCAPSLDPDTDVPFMNDLLAQGWEVTSSDYLNESALAPTSKKVLPYFVGEEAARNVIDIVRAARNMADADAGSDYQVWGWSEGGQTALWVNDIASTYAPELTLKGAVATAPAAEVVSSLYPSLAANSEYWPLLLMLAEGISSTYGNKAAPLKQLLTKTGIKLIGQTIKKEPQCLVGIIGTLTEHYSYNQLFLSQTIPPAWQRLLDQSDPADFGEAGPAPVLLVHGSADTIAPTSTSASLAQALCSLNPPQHLERWVYAGLDHVSIMGTPVAPVDPNGSDDAAYANSPSAADIIQWMGDRFADGAWPDPYVPTGAGSTTVTQTDTC